MVATELFRGMEEYYGTIAKITNKFAALFLKSPEDGALTQLYAATSPEINEKNYRGKFFVPNGEIGNPIAKAQDDELAEKLWKYTEDLINDKLRS